MNRGVIFLLVFFLLPFCLSDIYSLPSSVVVVRHGERAEGINLTPMGWERAGAFIGYFGGGATISLKPTLSQQIFSFSDCKSLLQASASYFIPTSLSSEPIVSFPPFPPPFAIYASQPTPNSRRPLETATPLAHALHLPVHTPFPKQDIEQLAHQILSTPAYKDKEILICYEHGEIPDLVNQLLVQAGGTELNLAKYPGNRFDLVYVIDYTGHPPLFSTPYKRVAAGDTISLTVTIQQLLYADPSVLPSSSFPLTK